MAVSLDGSSQRGTYSGAPTTASTLTMCGWFYVDSSQNAAQVLMSLGTSASANNRRDIICNVPVAQYQCRSINNAGTTVTAVLTSTGHMDAWRFIAGVWNGTADRTIYRGTTSNNNTTNNSPNAPNDTRVACSHTAGSLQKGRAALLGMWDVALTAAEITMLAEGYSPLVVRPGSLLACWPLMTLGTFQVELVGAQELSWVGSPTSIENPALMGILATGAFHWPTSAVAAFKPRLPLLGVG